MAKKKGPTAAEIKAFNATRAKTSAGQRKYIQNIGKYVAAAQLYQQNQVGEAQFSFINGGLSTNKDQESFLQGVYNNVGDVTLGTISKYAPKHIRSSMLELNMKDLATLSMGKTAANYVPKDLFVGDVFSDEVLKGAKSNEAKAQILQTRDDMEKMVQTYTLNEASKYRQTYEKEETKRRVEAIKKTLEDRFKPEKKAKK